MTTIRQKIREEEEHFLTRRQADNYDDGDERLTDVEQDETEGLKEFIRKQESKQDKHSKTQDAHTANPS